MKYRIVRIDEDEFSVEFLAGEEGWIQLKKFPFFQYAKNYLSEIRDGIRSTSGSFNSYVAEEMEI